MKKLTALLMFSFFLVVGTQAQWEVLRGNGQGKRIAMDASSSLPWVIGMNNGIYTYNQNGTWSEYPGGGRGYDIAVYRGTPYVVGTDHSIYKGTGSGWLRLPGGGKAKRIAVDASNGKIWVIGTNNGIYSYQGNTWKEYPGRGRGHDICVYRGTPYVVGMDNGIYKGTGSGWMQLPGGGKATNLAIDADKGQLVVIGTNAHIYFYQGSKWHEYTGKGKGIDICSTNGKPFILGLSHNIWRHTNRATPTPVNTNPGTAWAELPGGGKAKNLTVDPTNNRVWVIGTNNAIYYFNNGRWVEYPGGGRGYDVAVYRNTPYVIGLDNRIYRGTGSGWVAMPGNGKGKQIHVDTNTGRIWIVGMNNGIFHLK